MKRFFLAPALVLIVAAPAVYADPPKTDPSTKAVVVPFELLPSGHMAVKAKVNGEGPYWLIFDTGAPITLLDNKVAKAAGLLKGQPEPLFSLFGSRGEVKVKELQIGDEAVENVTAIVMDHPTVQAISNAFEKKLGGPIEGIVGFPFFARFKFTLDYQAKTVTLVPNGYNPPNVMEAMMTAIMAGPNSEPKVLAPAAEWGVIADKKEGDDEAGVTIKVVLPGGPAEAAGLKAGDRLLTIDGRWTDTMVDLYAAAGYVKPGAKVPVVVKRDGKEVTVQVKPASGL
ncbi:MAG TPA: aspartyl protease family protein [Gemmataceae bacterium]|nr:aspartyl protease family protein [Gemmataceae bacterium]